MVENEYEHPHQITREEKLKNFGEGEWLDEPDVYVFEYKDYKCIAWRTIVKEWDGLFFGGNLNGYIKLPEGHPWHGKSHDEIDCDCHGGLTYGDEREYALGFHIGFDCAHCMDIIPSLEIFKKENLSHIYWAKFCDNFKPTYKNMEFVINECKKIVDQAIEAELK